MNDTIYKRAVDFFGIKNQLIKTIEEIAELQTAIENDNKENIVEEIADVEIMFAQAEINFDLEIGQRCAGNLSLAMSEAIKYICKFLEVGSKERKSLLEKTVSYLRAELIFWQIGDGLFEKVAKVKGQKLARLESEIGEIQC